MSTELHTILGIVVKVATALLVLALGWKLKLRYDKRDRMQGFVVALRQQLPEINKAVNDAYLYSADLHQYRTILNEYKLTEAYTLLSKNNKKQIDATSSALDELLQRFSAIRIGLYEFFRSMPDPVGGGGPNEIVVTELVCMAPNEIPLKPAPVNFLRESRGSVSQALCTHGQMKEIWNMAHEKLEASEFLSARTKASEELQRLDNTLMKLQKL